MLVHARLPDMYMYHALLHACHVFNVLPLKNLVTSDGIITTPCELFLGSKPKGSHFRVFGCPCIAKNGTISVDGKPEVNSKGTQRGIRGIHLGFSPTQKGWLLYVPSTRQIVISGDVICDENFASTVAETWRPFHDALALRPETSFIPDPHTFVEHTGDMLSQVEEGNTVVRDGQTVTPLPYEEDIAHSDLISDSISEDKGVSSEEEVHATDQSVRDISAEAIPQLLNDGLDSNARRSTRTRNPPKLLTFADGKRW